MISIDRTCRHVMSFASRVRIVGSASRWLAAFSLVGLAMPPAGPSRAMNSSMQDDLLDYGLSCSL